MNEGIPDFLRLTREQRTAAWQGFKPKGPTGFTGPAPIAYGPGEVARKLGYELTESEIEGARAFRMQEQERKERTQVVAEKRQEKAEDESIKKAVIEHRIKRKRKLGKNRAIKTIKDVS